MKLGPWQFGVDFRQGIFVTPVTMLYGRIGFCNTKVQLASNIMNETILGSISTETTKHKRDNFFRCGGGIEQALSSKIHLHIDYIYTDYRTILSEASASAPLAATVSINESKNLHLHTHALKLGLSCYFTDYFTQMCNPYYPWSFCGFYLSGGVGGGLLDGRHTLSNDTSTIAGVFSNLRKDHLTDNAWHGIGYLGYGLQWRQTLFAGLEIFGKYSPLSRDKTDSTIFLNAFLPEALTIVNTIDTKININSWKYGIALRPGVIVAPKTLLYCSIGTAYAHLHAKSVVTYNNPSTGAMLTISDSVRKNRAVLRVGG